MAYDLGIFLIPAIILGAVIYFLPTIIAAARHKKQALAIFLLDLFAGWTGVGWLGALIWSVL